MRQSGAARAGIPVLVAQAGFEGVTTLRSGGVGTVAGVSIYSAIVSACKPVHRN